MVHRLGDDGLVLGRARQGLRLLVVVVLQAMLETAQEIVGAGEARDARGLDQPALGERLHGGARGGRAQSRLASAAHHLEELHPELDLADAARADLDVVRLGAPDRGPGEAWVPRAHLPEPFLAAVAREDPGL